MISTKQKATSEVLSFLLLKNPFVNVRNEDTDSTIPQKRRCLGLKWWLCHVWSSSGTVSSGCKEHWACWEPEAAPEGQHRKPSAPPPLSSTWLMSSHRAHLVHNRATILKQFCWPAGDVPSLRPWHTGRLTPWWLCDSTPHTAAIAERRPSTKHQHRCWQHTPSPLGFLALGWESASQRTHTALLCTCNVLLLLWRWGLAGTIQ